MGSWPLTRSEEGRWAGDVCARSGRSPAGQLPWGPVGLLEHSHAKRVARNGEARSAPVVEVWGLETDESVTSGVLLPFGTNGARPPQDQEAEAGLGRTSDCSRRSSAVCWWSRVQPGAGSLRGSRRSSRTPLRRVRPVELMSSSRSSSTPALER